MEQNEQRRASTACEHRQRRKTADLLGLVRSIRKGQRIEVLCQRPGLGLDHLARAQISKSRDLVPIAAAAEALDELEQGGLTLEARDAVDLRKAAEQLLVAQPRVVAANREVAGDSGIAQVTGQAAIVREEVLEYEREPDHQGLCGTSSL